MVDLSLKQAIALAEIFCLLPFVYTVNVPNVHEHQRSDEVVEGRFFETALKLQLTLTQRCKTLELPFRRYSGALFRRLWTVKILNDHMWAYNSKFS